MKPLLLSAFLFTYILIFANNEHNIVYYYNNAEYQKAVELAEKQIATAEPDFTVWYYKGLSEKVLSRYSDAAVSLTNAVNIDSTSISAWLPLAQVYKITGNIQKAIDSYNKILAMDSANITAKSSLANIFLKKEKYDSAAELYLQLIKQDSLNDWFYGQYAYCLGKMRLIRESDFYYKKAIQLNPGNKTVVVRMIRQFISNKRYETAEKYIDTFLLRFRDDIYLLKQKAFISAFSGNYLSAVRQFKHITELGDSSLFTLKYYGQSLYNNGEYADAIFWLSKYVSIKPNDTKNMYILALAYQKDYKYQKSLKQLNLVFEQIYNTKVISDVFVEKGNTLLAYGDYLSYRDSMKTQSKTKYKESLSSYKKAQELNSSNNDINKKIAILYETKLKNDQLALYYYNRYYKNLNTKETDEYLLAWVQKKITELTEKLHFEGE
jgi:tetratricopeptide (TPR) repeat protein